MSSLEQKKDMSDTEIDKVVEKWESIGFDPVLFENTTRQTGRRDILDFGNKGFLLGRLLTKEECRCLIDGAENVGFKPIEGATQEYRGATRLMVKDDALASVLWERILPYLTDIEIQGDPHKLHIHGVESLLKGKWQPLKLNNHFRVCKYEPGGHFAPHYDGFFTESSQVRSVISVVVYLNEDFDDGNTNFLDDTQTHHVNAEGKQCAEKKNILYKIKPETGTGLLFHHHRFHEGEAVRNGIKYILRTDVMFQHVDSKSLDPKVEEALQIAQEAERFECCGHQKKAVRLFNKAFEMFPILATSYKT